jgi:two-component system chemotaxis response regulator CheB
VSGAVHTSDTAFDAVALLTSAGGLEALTAVLARLPERFPLPVIAVQHRPPSAGDALVDILARRTALSVRTIEAGDRLAHRGVGVVSGGCNAIVNAADQFELSPTTRTLWPGDALLTSLAFAHGERTIAVVLTGRLNDGTSGIRAIKRRGGRVIVQDPGSAHAAGMPSSALATGCVDFVLPAARIASALIALVMAPGGDELLRVAPRSWAMALAP